MNLWAISILMVLSIGCPDPAPQPADHEIQVFELAIEKRGVALADDAIRVRQGQQVKIRWLTDEPASVHLHGYDIEASLSPGTPVVWNFEANATGRFAIEAHDFEPSDEEAPTHDHSDHDDHDDHSPETPASDSESTDRTLLYFEVHPR
jgi:hypothetical protein